MNVSSRALNLLADALRRHRNERATRWWEDHTQAAAGGRGPVDRDWAAGADRVDEYKVEYDWARTPVLAASVDRDVDAEKIGTATGPGGTLRDLYSDAQHRFLHDCGPAMDIPWTDLQPASPITELPRVLGTNSGSPATATASVTCARCQASS